MIPILWIVGGALAAGALMAGPPAGPSIRLRSYPADVPPDPATNEPRSTTTPAPGAYVIPTADNTRPVHVFAARAGARFVDLDWAPDQALVWRAYFGVRKDKAKWSTSRWAQLDPVIGARKVWRKVKGKLGSIFKAAGNALAFRFGKLGQNLADLLVANELLAFDGGQQTTARLMVRATAQQLVDAILDHPRNAGLPRVAERGGPLGAEERLPVGVANVEIYFPTGDEIAGLLA